MDVVIPLAERPSAWANNELRYALRAWEKNFPDLGRVFICCIKPPAWLRNCEVLRVPDSHKRNKDANLIDKLLAACKAGCTAQFIRASDDELLLLPSTASDLKPYHCGPLGAKPKAFWGGGGWKDRLLNTFKVLIRSGETTFHFDSHLPKVYDRRLFMELCKRYPYGKGKGLCIDTWYLNHVQHATRYPLNGEKLTCEKDGPRTVEAARVAAAGRRYLGYADAGLTPGLKQFLQETFSEPSRYEE